MLRGHLDKSIFTVGSFKRCVFLINVISRLKVRKGIKNVNKVEKPNIIDIKNHLPNYQKGYFKQQ